MSPVIKDHSAVVQAALQRQRDEIAAIAHPESVEAFERKANISLKHRYFFCETPKAACSTIKLTLFRAELEDEHFEFAENRQIHIAELSPLLKPMMVPNLADQLKTLFKFCFVRDPATRLLAAYLDKVARNKPQKVAVLKALNRADDPGFQIGFPTFVDFICDQDSTTLDSHWSVQFHQICVDRISYDFIGRFENFATDFRLVLDRLGIDQKYLSLATSHQTNASQQQSEFLTPALRRKIEACYSLDYEAFGY